MIIELLEVRTLKWDGLLFAVLIRIQQGLLHADFPEHSPNDVYIVQGVVTNVSYIPVLWVTSKKRAQRFLRVKPSKKPGVIEELVSCRRENAHKTHPYLDVWDQTVHRRSALTQLNRFAVCRCE